MPGAGLIADDAGVHLRGELHDAPPLGGGRHPLRVTVDEDAQYLREQQAAMDEQGRRVRRYGASRPEVGQVGRRGL